MKIRTSDIVPFVIVIVGLATMVAAEWFSSLVWQGINWSNFFSTVGLYIAAVLSFQWAYDRWTNREVIRNAVDTAIANKNVFDAGIEDCKRDTKEIDYQNILSKSDQVTIGFLHSAGFVDSNFELLKERADTGKKTTIILSKPDGSAIEYLLTIAEIKDHIIPNITKVISRVDQEINGSEEVRQRICIMFHDAVLRYSFVHSSDGIWVKMYRNGRGTAATPGIFVRNDTPLFEFFDKDVRKLEKEANNG